MTSVKLAIGRIRAGSTCASDILDDAGSVLIAKGIPISEQFLEELKGRGISIISVSQEDALELVGKTQQKDGTSSGNAGTRADRSNEPYSTERGLRFAKSVCAALGVLDDLGSDICNGSSSAFGELVSIQGQFVDMLIEDTDQSIAAAVGSEDNSLAKRSTQLAMLSMATAIEMELTPEDVVLSGSCAILHDLGLYTLPAHFRDASQTLSHDDAELYRTHPEITAKILGEHPVFSDELRTLTTQVHELPDGSGYPRGIKKARFHRLTSLLSLVETYVALTHPTPTRPALVGHDAITFMLFQCRGGLLDPLIMRAFVNQCTLYGIDSRVLLDDGEAATIIRRDGQEYDRPVVILDASGKETATRLRETDRRIHSAIRNERQMQVNRSTIESFSLHDMGFA